MKHLSFFLTILGLSFLISCGNDENVPTYTDANGVFVVNEGAFLAGNGTISFAVGQKVYDRIFDVANGRGLGDVVQSYSIANGRGYAVVNNDNKMEVVNASTMASVATISGLRLPRYFLAISPTKGYLSNWGSFDGTIPAYISVIDLATNTVSDSIAIGAFMGAEQLVLSGNKVFVGNTFERSVSVVNISTEEITANIPTADAPSSMELSNGNLWVLCAGSYGNDFNTSEDDTHAMLYKIDPATNTALDSLAIGEKGDHPNKMDVAPDGQWALIINGNKVLKINLVTLSVEGTPFASGESFYGLGIRSDEKVFLCDSEGFASEGTLHVYNKSGVKEYSIGTGGVGPNGVFFLK